MSGWVAPMGRRAGLARAEAGHAVGSFGGALGAPIGPLFTASRGPAAWGADKRARGRAEAVGALLAAHGVDLHVLGPGKPQHPLYLPRTARPVRWTP